MNVVLFDDHHRNHLLPLTFTRPMADIRIGITTLREKWEFYLQTSTSTLTESYLSIKYPLTETDDNMLIAGSVIPNQDIVSIIRSLKKGEILTRNGEIIASRQSTATIPPPGTPSQETTVDFIRITQLPSIFQCNDKVLRDDFQRITSQRKRMSLGKQNMIIGNENDIFVEEGAHIAGAILNSQTGPIYIGKESEIMEGACIRGPFSLGEHATVKMGAKIYGATTIGPHCKVGGELNNVVFTGYSNKAHDGFLGNSVIGEWCNLGADTNSSNLKNNYASIRLWNYALQKFADTETPFCGLIMGDHSKCGISSMFNSGTVVGVGCNLYGTGYHRNFVPSFSFGGPTSGYHQYLYEKFAETASRVLSRRDKTFDQKEEDMMQHLYHISTL